MNGNFAEIVNRNRLHNDVEPMQVETPPEDNSINRHTFYEVNVIVDLEYYVNRYVYNGLWQRLIFIADHCPPMRIIALQILLSQLLKSSNVNLYQVIHQRLVEQVINANGPDVSQEIPPLNNEWIEATQKKSDLMLKKAENELKTSKKNFIKESIRRCYNQLGDIYFLKGDLPSCLKCYLRGKDNCTTDELFFDACVKMIKVSFHLQNWSTVLSYVAKAMATQNYVKVKENHPLLCCSLRCCAGIAELSVRQFKKAALQFVHVILDNHRFHGVVLSEDLAMYAGLCALATFERVDLKNFLFKGSFKHMLDLKPTLRDAIRMFYEARYAACLTVLDTYKNTFKLDMYLGPHIPNLFARIRCRALTQYLTPYMSVDLRRMALVFGRPVPELEENLSLLILHGQIQARIDSHRKVLHAWHTDQKQAAFTRALAVGKEQVRRTRMLVLRLAVLNSRIQVQSPSEQGEDTQSQMQVLPSEAIQNRR